MMRLIIHMGIHNLVEDYMYNEDVEIGNTPIQTQTTNQEKKKQIGNHQGRKKENKRPS